MSFYHLKCIGTNYQRDLHWICSRYLQCELPFNNVDDDDVFFTNISELWFDLPKINFAVLNNKLFIPFEINDGRNHLPMYDNDPDFHFFSQAHFVNSLCNSQYHLEDSFNAMIDTNMPDQSLLSLFHMNIRSLPAHIKELEDYLSLLNYNFRIIGITETWLKESNHEIYNLLHYNHLKRYRSERDGGGVSLFIDCKLNYVERDDISIVSDVVETIFAEIQPDTLATTSSENVIVGVIYRPPGASVDGFIAQMENMLDTIKSEKKSCYLMGDFNINLLNSETHSGTSSFMDLMFSNFYLPSINRPTRVTDNTATLIDNIFSNVSDSENIPINGILYTDISDHLPIFRICFKKLNVTKPLPHFKQIINDKTLYDLKVSLGSHNWDSVMSSHDPNQAFSVFLKDFQHHYSKAIPIKTFSSAYKLRKPWLTEGLLNSIKRKNKLYQKRNKNKLKYTSYRNRLTHLLRIAEKRYYSHIFEQNKQNLSQVWKVINGIINKRKVAVKTSRFKHNNKILTEAKDIANQFNLYFTTVGSNLAKKIRDIGIKPEFFLQAQYINSFFFSPVTENDIQILINSLRDSSPGYDDIKPKVVKHVSTEIIVSLTHIINVSLETGIFPNDLKIAKVLPLFKKGDREIFSNYRPISLLTCFSKLFEKVAYNQLQSYLDKLDILYQFQFGFRKQYNTDLAVSFLSNRIAEALEKQEHSIGIFLDLSKAFDTVDHSILLNKLNLYGIRGLPLQWFSSYLSERQQYVHYQNAKSNLLTITWCPSRINFGSVIVSYVCK